MNHDEHRTDPRFPPTAHADHGKERTPEDPSILTELLAPKPHPPVVADTYSARVGREAGITKLDGIECWWYQHGLHHMGQIEHARALVGLEGMTS